MPTRHSIERPEHEQALRRDQRGKLREDIATGRVGTPNRREREVLNERRRDEYRGGGDADE